MTETKLSAKKLSTLTAAIAAGTTVPQFADAAIVTVGGDGGTGSITLDNTGDTTNLGGLLIDSISFFETGSSAYLRDNLSSSQLRLFEAIRSSVAGIGSASGSNWTFSNEGSEDEGALFNSDDNWVPGFFRVNGVNSGDQIYGWLQVQLGASNTNFDPTILSFTYDDAATDTTAFTKPIGGFSVSSDSAVPEPSSFALTALALGAAGVAALRRRRKDEVETESTDA